MPRLEIASTGAFLEDLPNSVEIQQAGRKYRARKWQLTPEVRNIIHLAEAHGFGALWTKGHPKDDYFEGGSLFSKGIHHISFARGHDEAWVFAIDGNAAPPIPRHVVFNKRLFSAFERRGRPFRWEHSGGHNLLIDPADLPTILKALDQDTLNDVFNTAPQVSYLGRQTVENLRNEQDLHEKLFTDLRQPCELHGYQLSSKPRIDNKIPDLIIDAKSEGQVIIELKFTHCGHAQLDQLINYLHLKTFHTPDQPVRGVIVARDFNDEIKSRASKSAFDISLYSFKHQSGWLRLRRFYGPSILENLQLVPLE